MSTTSTKGCHHIGLTVSDLDKSAAFFTDILEWNEVGGNPDYPAIFVSDGTVLVTLWKSNPDNDKSTPTAFNKNQNIGLHHLALAVESENKLNQVYENLTLHNIEIEFPPELLNQGPAKHMMCYEPSGIRIEFIYPGD